MPSPVRRDSPSKSTLALGGALYAAGIGVPRAVLIVLAGTAPSFHLPLETIPLLLGVDALMDMGRTTVNVVGNCLASVVVARWEGKFVLSDDKADLQAES